MTAHPAIVWWLRIVAAMVVATLLVGGATRITDSGLSITEWEPILGVIPPLTHAAWLEALDAYRQIPEYQLVNKGMSLSAFQVIYWWEWGHRMIARTIGLVFVIPLVVFWLRGMLPQWFKPWALLLLALGGLQGFVGWWMVSSGLVDRVDVSQYRLAVHLLLACFILALTVWLSVRLSGRAGAVPAPPIVKISGAALAVALFVQIGLGALVAGIDAGLASDTWPLMAGALVPEGLSALAPPWLNAFENPLTVQFNHRVAGYLVVAVAALHALAAARAGAGQRGALVLLALVVAQAISGILVVVWQVPPVLAGLHQVTAAITLWVAVAHATMLVGAPRTMPTVAMPAAAE
jgi:cytochrome c oxidase assembly protein subunit 15